LTSSQIAPQACDPSLRFRLPSIYPSSIIHSPFLASEHSLQLLHVRLSWKRRSACEGGAGGEAFSSAWASETRQQPLCCYLQLACRAPSLLNRSTRARGPWISKASWVQFLRTSSQHMPLLPWRPATWLHRSLPSPALFLLLFSLLPASKQTTRRREFQCLKKQGGKPRAEEDDGETIGMKEEEALGSC